MPHKTLAVEIAVCGLLVVSLRALARRSSRLRTSSRGDNMFHRAGGPGWGVPLIGLDASGRYLFTLPPVGVRNFVIFVVRARSLGSDLSFWGSVDAQTGARRGVFLEAYCDSAACAEAAHKLRAQPFPIIAFGQPGAFPALARADREGVFLVLGRHGVVKARYPWRSDTATAGKVASEVLR